MMSRPTAHRLFSDLRSAEETADAYRNLAHVVDLLADAHPGSIRAEITLREAARLRELLDEHEADADDCRAAILAAGYTPEDYEGWVARRTAKPRPTAEQYAAVLVELIRADMAAEPDRYAAARSFEDLHDVCDANEYLIQADARTGNPDPFDVPEGEGYEVDDAELDAYATFTSRAIDLAAAELWPTEVRP